MLEWIPAALKGVDTFEKTTKALSALIKGKKKQRLRHMRSK